MIDLNSIQQRLQKQDDQQPPLESWHPAFCGDIDMQIDDEGRWFYMGSPIGRAALVKLFARVIWREDDRYFLLTPVEKVGIRVADVPFLVTDWQRVGDGPNGAIQITTNVHDTLILDRPEQLELRRHGNEGVTIPYINIRRNLWARLHRNVYYQWIEQSAEEEGRLQLTSGDITFTLGQIDQ